MNVRLFELNKIVGYIIMIILIIVFARAVTNYVGESSEADTSLIEDSINSALMQCYALEGAYPSDLYHLEEYGVWINEDKYFYDYDYFDGGIMPMVNVINKPK